MASMQTISYSMLCVVHTGSYVQLSWVNGWNPVAQGFFCAWTRNYLISSGKSSLIKDDFGVHITHIRRDEFVRTEKSPKESFNQWECVPCDGVIIVTHAKQCSRFSNTVLNSRDRKLGFHRNKFHVADFSQQRRFYFSYTEICWQPGHHSLSSSQLSSS